MGLFTKIKCRKGPEKVVLKTVTFNNYQVVYWTNVVQMDGSKLLLTGGAHWTIVQMDVPKLRCTGGLLDHRPFGRLSFQNLQFGPGSLPQQISTDESNISTQPLPVRQAMVLLPTIKAVSHFSNTQEKNKQFCMVHKSLKLSCQSIALTVCKCLYSLLL